MSGRNGKRNLDIFKREETDMSVQDEVIYQIYPKSFYDTSGQGTGTLKGITKKLDYLQSLGITTLWLSPIFPSPMKDNGYDISDYRSVDPRFGTLNDLDTLIEKAHDKGMKIMLDLVFNHTSDQHPWFQKALQDPQSPYHDYYIFQPGPEEPNNLRSVFGGSTWQKVEGRGEYYFHAFSAAQPDLNWANPKVRDEMAQIVEFWKSHGIEAFRIDAINFIKKPEKWKSITPDGPDGRGKCTRVVRNAPGMEIYLQELADRCFEQGKIITVGETAGLPYEALPKFIGDNGIFNMVFDFKAADLDIVSGDEWFSRINWTTPDLKERIEQSQMAMQQAGWAANFLENHDQPRVTTKYLREHQDNLQAKKMLAMLQMMLRGTPFLFQGQELGMVNFERTSPDQFDDLSSIDQYHRAQEAGFSDQQALHFANLRSRDNGRVPFPWDDSPNVGFTTGTPWLEINHEAKARNLNAKAALDNPESLFYFYKKLIALRKENETLKNGSIRFIKNTSPDLIVYVRESEEKPNKESKNQNERFYVICSFSDQPQNLELPAENKIRKIFGNRPSALRQESNTISLEPFECLLLQENA